MNETKKHKIADWLENVALDKVSLIRFLIKGYGVLSVLCLLLLLLPIFHNQKISFIDHLFFAISIVSTTGLVPAAFADVYNFGGQLVSLFFIQLGGIGYMALGSMIILKSRKKLPDLTLKLLKLEFNIPRRYPLIKFIYSIVVFTILIEGIGAACLYWGFQKAGVENPLWSAIFHSISAFCTAGFSLYNDSFTQFANEPIIIASITSLSLLGSIGFIVFLDFYLKIWEHKRSITLTSKIIILATLMMWFLGTLSLFLSDETLLNQGLWQGIQTALFQTMSAHTTVGFNTYDYGHFSLASTSIILLLMVIGASPSGTGGGVKTTSVVALYAVTKLVVRGREDVTFLNRKIPTDRIHLAVATMSFYFFILFIGFWAILLIEKTTFSFDKILFECISALSTAGISMGITGELSSISKIVICVLMFIGRVGVITFGLSFIRSIKLLENSFIPEEDIAL